MLRLERARHSGLGLQTQVQDIDVSPLLARRLCKRPSASTPMVMAVVSPMFMSAEACFALKV